MNQPTLVLVAHGTRSRQGVDMISTLAEAVRQHVDDVRVAFVDVLGPGPAEVLRECAGDAVLVPAFLASGYHVYTEGAETARVLQPGRQGRRFCVCGRPAAA